MDEIPKDPPIQPGERIEHHEVIERVSPGREVPPEREVTPVRRGTPMWVWVLPLVLVVLFLAWYVLNTGEPSAPLSDVDGIEVGVPDVELSAPSIDNTTVIELPDAPAPAAAEPAAAEPAGQP